MHMRSLIYVPGNSFKMISKMVSFAPLPDVFVPDLEDSVPNDHKDFARKIISDFIQNDWKKVKEKHKNGLPLMIPR